MFNIETIKEIAGKEVELSTRFTYGLERIDIEPTELFDILNNSAVEVDEDEAKEIVKSHPNSYKDAHLDKVRYDKDRKFFYLDNRNFGTKIYMKLKVTDKKLLNYIALNSSMINKSFASAETKEEEERYITNNRRFVKANLHKTLGKRYKGIRQGEYQEFKDKEGNPIELKQGFLYKCDKCNSYKPLDNMEVTILFSVYHSYDKVELIVYEIIVREIECSVCKDMPDTNKVSFISEDRSSLAGTIHREVFNDLKEKGKIAISNIEIRRSFFGDRFTTKTINKKIVLNAITGRAYMLPEYNLDTKRRKGKLEQIGIGNIHHITSDIFVPFKDICEAGLSIEQYLRENNICNSKAIIPFKDYLIDFIKHDKRNYNDNDADKIVSNATKYIDSLINKTYDVEFSSDYYFNTILPYMRSMRVLIAYNNNPYVSHHPFNEISEISIYNKQGFGNMKLPSKIVNMKRIRNENLLKDFNTLFNIKSNTEKKFMQRNNNRLVTSATFIYFVKKLFKNKDNINKFLNAYDRQHIDIYSNAYLDKLVESFGETNVANALTKEDKIEQKPMTPFSSYSRRRNFYLYRDTIRNYEDIISVIPDYKLPVNRLRLKDLHDKISKDATKIKKAEKIYTYEDKFLDMYDNKVIDDITFTVAKSNHELTAIGSQMHICVGGYWSRVETGELFIVSMSKNNKYIGCLEISKDAKLHQAKATCNRMLADDELKALKKYSLDTNLKTSTNDVPDKYKVDSSKDKNSVKYNKAIKLSITTKKSIGQLLEEVTTEGTEEQVREIDQIVAF